MRNLLALLALTLAVSPVFCQVSPLVALKAQPETRLAPAPSFSVSAPELYKTADIKAEYYGEQLFSYLHELTAPAPRKAEPSYSASRNYMYSKADNTGCNGRAGIVTFYSQVCVNGNSGNGNDYKEQGDANGDGVVDTFINAEHIWPQGYFAKRLPMVADLHHLAPTFVTPNGRRANFKFGPVSNYTYRTSAGSKMGNYTFEPADAVKGNVARAMLYFIVRYYDRDIRQGMNYNEFWTSRVQLFLDWNRQDPPDAAEKRRNDLVEQFQGNRNPFIDDHTLADRIGLQTFMKH
jgi:hypothetical protein